MFGITLLYRYFCLCKSCLKMSRSCNYKDSGILLPLSLPQNTFWIKDSGDDCSSISALVMTLDSFKFVLP